MSRWFLSSMPGYIRAAPDPADAFTPIAAFTTRTGGVSAAPFDSLNLSEGVGDDPQRVRENRSRVLGALGLSPAQIAYATQVHGAHVLVPPGPGWAGTADALATHNEALVLAVGTADCLAVLLWDATRPFVAGAHAGWRGTLAGVVPHAVEALTAFGSSPQNLRAALGPRIGACCFEVSADVAERFPDDTVVDEHGRLTVDLAQAVTRQLRGLGLAASSIRDVALDAGIHTCTASDPERYFSHRRDKGRTGRSWGILAARPAAPAQAHEQAV
jgi:YfiH family protein